MFAVFKSGGKQYKVEKDSKVLIEKVKANAGDEIILKNILMISDGNDIKYGSPEINDAAVLAEVVKQTRGPKITIIYKRRRKNSRRKQGHKQNLTLIKIKDIALKDASKIIPKTKMSEPTPSKKNISVSKSKKVDAKKVSKSKKVDAKKVSKSKEK